jgi:hypothetical protein
VATENNGERLGTTWSFFWYRGFSYERARGAYLVLEIFAVLHCFLSQKTTFSALFIAVSANNLHIINPIN